MRATARWTASIAALVAYVLPSAPSTADPGSTTAH
jgi:hypothetical protein